MTAFADYLDLRTAVIEDVKRPDIADKFDRITKLAESWLNNNVRMADQITETTVTFSSGTASLPADFREAIGLYNSSGLEYVQQPATQTEVVGAKSFYSIQGSNLVSQALDGDYTFQYYAKISTITTSMTTSNWLLQKYPSLYLYAVGVEAAKSIRDMDAVAALTTLRNGAFEDARTDDETYRYSRARVRVQGATP